MSVQKKYVKPFQAGCGWRRGGKAYMVTNLQKYVREDHFPLEYFVYDPPIRITDPGAWRLSPQGISYIEKQGVWHALDWIGQSFYANAADVLEEALLHQGSGLLPLTDLEHISKLQPGKSRRLLFHPHGWIKNLSPFKTQRVTIPERGCALPEGPTRAAHQHDPEQACALMHWQAVTDNWVRDANYGDPRLGTVTVGDTQYTAAKPPEGVTPEFDLALIAWLPIDEIHVVDSPDTESVQKALKLLNEISQIPVFLTNA